MRQYAISIAGWSEKTGTLTCAAGYFWAVTDEQARAEAVRLAGKAYRPPVYTVRHGNAFPTGFAQDANGRVVLLDMKTAENIRGGSLPPAPAEPEKQEEPR